MPSREALTDATYTERIAFVVDLARHLHAYGTTSQRMEAAVESVARKLALECEPWSNPTGLILAFSDPARPAGESDTTPIIRPRLGDTNLRKLCEADRIAEDHLAAVRDKIARLKKLEHELERIVSHCGGHSVEDCYVIRALSDHAMCEAEH